MEPPNFITIVPEVQKDAKKIELVQYLEQHISLNHDHENTATLSPDSFASLTLINRGSKFDVILATPKHPSRSIVYLGHWNDGVA